MKDQSTCVIETFFAKEPGKRRSTFQLTKEDGLYYIKRDSSSILKLQEEDKARKGFQRLKEKWSTEKKPR